ncbi:ClC family H(+)/Cl(-) exchange transporter [Christensenella timonensis]|uniref:ClC family H(+)/Cl(-) exchange transporter n=1 Tax=Christensenella timonensis TaxID=1816678 RepID=UPI00082F322B|nr:ClC family H(+)/Cl(-) exchange transporter [Christensenella timonensis]
MKNSANDTHTVLHRFKNFRYGLLVQGIVVGALAGLVSVLFRLAIENANEVLSFILSAAGQNILLMVAWFGVLMIFAVITAKLVRWQPMISGSGIPQVEGEIHGVFSQSWWKVLVGKFAGGVLSIGAGLSLGREGPSIQLGAMMGKGFSRMTKRIKVEEKLLMTCGASAGLAAAFNAPFAGVLFSLEELHKNFSIEVLLSTMAASVTADFISRNVFGLKPIFSFHLTQNIPLDLYWVILILGAVLGVGGALYNFCIKKSQQLYGKMKKVRLEFRLMIPFFCAGLLGFTFPAVLGGGNQLIPMLIDGKFALAMVFAIFLVKFIFSMVSFGSGAPGGIFLPLLVLGALLGGGLGMAMIDGFGLPQDLLQNFIILAMAGFFAAIVRAPITGIILICEMTGSFTQLLSLTLVSLIAYAVADLLKAKPIYEQLLERIIETNGEKQTAESGGNKILLEIPVHHGAPICMKKISEIKWPQQSLIVAVRRGSHEIIPKGTVRIRPGDILIVLCNEENSYMAREQIVGWCQTA